MEKYYGKLRITCKHGGKESDNLLERFGYYKTIWKVFM